MLGLGAVTWCPHQFVLLSKEWYPSNSTLHRSRPIHYDDTQVETLTKDGVADSAPKTMELFPDSRRFGDFEWPDDSSTLDDETEDDGLEVVVDLVSAGVFKRTLGILKEQPRCVLCSVCFKIGDKVSVSNNPSCEHQYHQDCIRRWIKNRSDACPVCRVCYTVSPKLSRDDLDG